MTPPPSPGAEGTPPPTPDALPPDSPGETAHPAGGRTSSDDRSDPDSPFDWRIAVARELTCGGCLIGALWILSLLTPPVMIVLVLLYFFAC